MSRPRDRADGTTLGVATLQPRGPRADSPDVTVSRRPAASLLSLAVVVLSVVGLTAPASADAHAPGAAVPVPAVPAVPSTATVDLSGPAAGAALGLRVERVLAAAGATTIAAAVDVQGYDAVLRRGAELSLPPASTQKSFTGLSALVALGPTARFRTRVVTDRAPVRGRLRGSVWLVAGGDPYLTGSDLRALARQVRAAGIVSVSGGVRVDDSRYDRRRTAGGWRSSFMPGQSGPLSALAVDRNTWRRDRAFLADPAVPTAVRFRDLLRAEGVVVTGAVTRAPAPVASRQLAVKVSAPLPVVVRRALKDSDNFASELLLKELGRVVTGRGSSLAGVAASRQVLGGLGVTVGASADGSGLSSTDRQTPAGQVQLLRAADRSGVGPAFRAALPVGCGDGTLRRRFCGTPAAGRVMAKTGTLTGVRALAGYTTTASGRQVWFAFQLTGVTDGARALRAMDRAVVLLASAPE